MCCCVPFGIPAIVYAAKVNGLLAAGDLRGAQEASKTANTWMWVAFGCGFVAQLLGIALQVLGAVASSME